MDDIIRMEHVTFTYPATDVKESFNALNDLTLSIEKGSFVAVIGQNGSGKSTMAKLVNALLLPGEGTVWVNGYDTRDEAHLWDVRQSAGMVFQNPDNQIVSSIVEDDVAFGPENLGVEPAEIRRRVDEALEAVGMTAFRKNAPHLLSGGQKHRIAIAGAIAMRPQCIVFDEPTAMLDPKGRKEVMRIIRQLHAEGITCILITHFMEEAAQADRIVILNDGRIYMDGTPHEIFADRDSLMALGLNVPMAVDLSYQLHDLGIDLPAGIVEEEELIEALCPSK
jgi:energy-coupling factor transport system ATP-binding protein